MTEIHVRYATLDDVERLAPLFDAYRVFYQQCSDLNLAQQFLRERLALGESVILLAESAGEAVGFIQLYPLFSSSTCQRILLLNDLFVAKVARGQGVARRLMARATQHAEQVGIVRLELSTAHSNLQAQALYESLGYQLDREFRYYSLTI
ncbi:MULTISPECIES: GNAT family N-acetyltransferase [Deefgea]|uniref:GNAT family N-acetyltransferase n=1 Tax=Deefgea chitinilytica TaxID=570276 RepID=A0ABS2CBG6_9NEIS|nr:MULTISPECIES: GNAT family N-acetyltransferase [Deefgea]MBM5571490.1 GNAT family N-acetyltransferase [Deefgea chitinilytica]MBM9888723.1 GNAT family N-acetyltransferase [Deefgea sp. CFH1-16]